MYARIPFVIWLIASACNTLLMAASLGFSLAGDTSDFGTAILTIVFFGFLLSLGFSLPAFIILTIVLSFCEDLSCRQLRKVIIITSFVLTAGTYLAITAIFSTMGDLLFLLYTSLLAVAIGIACQWKAIKELSPGNLQPDSHEN